MRDQRHVQDRHDLIWHNLPKVPHRLVPLIQDSRRQQTFGFSGMFSHQITKDLLPVRVLQARNA